MSHKRKTNFEENVIFNESCLDTLSRMPDNCLDIVITSPPYNMNLRIRKGDYCSRQIVKEISTKYEDFSDNLPIDDFYSFHKQVLSELIRVSDLVFYNIQIVTGSKRAFFKLIGDFSENLKDVIVWDKKHAQPAIGTQVLNRRSELILVFEKSYPISRQFRNARFKRGTLDDIWLIERERSAVPGHGATFPEKLIFTILDNFSDANDIVYDPFLGTGTTAVVAKKLGIKYLGSEISKKYYDLANERIADINEFIFNEKQASV